MIVFRRLRDLPKWWNNTNVDSLWLASLLVAGSGYMQRIISRWSELHIFFNLKYSFNDGVQIMLLYTLFGRLFASYAFKLACNYRRLWSISCPRIIGCDECCFEAWPLTGCREGWTVGITWKVPFPTFGGAIFCIIGTVWEVTKIRVNMKMVLCVMVKVVSFDATMIAWARTKNLTRKGSVLWKRKDRWFEIMAKRWSLSVESYENFRSQFLKTMPMINTGTIDK